MLSPGRAAYRHFIASGDSAATSGLFLNILSQKRLAYAAAIPFAATVLRT